MYTAKTFLCCFVVLIISNYVASQGFLGAFPGFGQGFQIPSIPGFGGQGSNQGSGSGGFLAFPFHFPQLPNRPHGPRPNRTTTTTESSVDSSASSNSSDSSSDGSRRRRDAGEQNEEAYQAPQEVAAAPSGEGSQQQQNASPNQHHNRFLDFHFHRGRRAAAASTEN